jgi:hypothetical protein
MTLGNMSANGVRTLAAQSRGSAADNSVLILSGIGRKDSNRVAPRFALDNVFMKQDRENYPGIKIHQVPFICSNATRIQVEQYDGMFANRTASMASL